MSKKQIVINEASGIILEASVSRRYESITYSRPVLEGQLYVTDQQGFKNLIGDLVGDNENDLLSKANHLLTSLEHSLRTQSLTHSQLAAFIHTLPGTIQSKDS